MGSTHISEHDFSSRAAKLGRTATKFPYWDRSFHLDGPHGHVTYPHFNADFGPLKVLNHQAIPAWAYRLGSTNNLRIIATSALAIGVGLDAYTIATANNRCQAILSTAGGWAVGGLGGAGGSLLLGPGVGTILGGSAGGSFGGWVGDKPGQHVCQ